MSVRQAQREIDSREFAEWMAYANVEPFGPLREDQRAGVVAAILANVNRDSEARPEPFTVDEFFPRYEGDSVEDDPVSDEDRLKNKLMTWAATVNAANQDPSSESNPRRDQKE